MEKIMEEEDRILKLQKQIERLKKAVKKQRYGLVWMDIPEAFEDDIENKLPILKEVPELAIENDDGKPTHILIEGDNYHALTCLNYTHKSKIDVIYIDPPYNTGSDGFRYKDKRIIDKFPDGTEVPKDHSFRHSYWLSFMRKRLELARNLLKDTGVMFISIDDNELAQLKLLCDDIFGESNFVETFVWNKTQTPPSLSNKCRGNVEYVLCYEKKLNRNKYFGKKSNNSDAPLINKGNGIKELTFPVGSVRFNIPDGIYRAGNYSSVRVLEDFEVENGRNKTTLKIAGEFKWVQSNLEEELSLGTYFLIKSRKMSIRYQKTDENVSEMLPNKLIDASFGVRTNEEASKELREMAIQFNFSKPRSLIAFLIEMVTYYSTEEIVVLDFFAGSGTTGHAVMELNQEDKGTRQFILVTNNENKIMGEVCYPRIKKAINGYTKLNGEEIKGLGNSLKYYKTAFVGRNGILNTTDDDKIELAHNAGELLAIAENTLELVKQNDHYQLFEDSNKDKYTAIYFREELEKFDDFVKMVEKLQKKTIVYVFSWSNEEFSTDFAYLKNVKVKTIPLPILEIYKNIYNLG